MQNAERAEISTLPRSVPLVPDWEVEARLSAPAGQAAETGAWFNVVVLPSGRAVLALGRVPGSGEPVVRTAAKVGESVVSAFVQQADLDCAWEAANVAVARLPKAQDASALVVVLDPPDAEVWYATADHDGPLFFDVAGVSRLPATGSAPLGSPTPSSARLGPIDGHVTVVLTSAVLDVGERMPVSTGATAAPPDAATAAQAVLDLMSRHDEPYPIAALVARRRRIDTPTLRHDLSPDSTSVRTARLALEDWLHALGAAPMDVLSLVHATVELLTNAIEHAPVPGLPAREVHLRCAHLAAGEVVIDVEDHGRWRTPTYDIARGRGLAMAAGLAHELSVTTGPDGTRARLLHRLTRPVLTEVQPLPQAPSPHVEISAVAPGRLRMSGVLAHDDVDLLTDALDASADRVDVAELDLTEVTALSPAALKVLDDLTRTRLRENGGTGVALMVRAGSIPHVELERADIPYTLR